MNKRHNQRIPEGVINLTPEAIARDRKLRALYETDGQLSGLCNKGLTVAEVSPESAVVGPISLVRNGDSITIDVDRRILDLEVSKAELAARRSSLGEPVRPRATEYLSIYQRTVQPMSKGAVLVRDIPDENT